MIEFVRRGGLEQALSDELEPPLQATLEAERLGQTREVRARFFENERLFARSGSSPIERLFRTLSALFE